MNLNPNLQAIKATTQEHLDIYNIIDDLLVLKDGTISLVLETSAVNFDLLSEMEQESRVKAFAGLLNSLTFHLQILIRTQNIDISNYVAYLERKKDKEMSPVIRSQIAIYIQFVKNLIRDRNVLDKRFFVVIPHLSGTISKTSLAKQLFGREMKITNVDWLLEKAKTQLIPKRDHVIRELKRMGVGAKQLTSEELVSLFYNVYNPGMSPLQKIQIKPEEYQVPIVEGTSS